MPVLVRLVKWIATAFALALLLTAAGFLVFVAATGPQRLPAAARADGIVALTGGKARIGEAVRLLSEGRAKRMLISGVHPTTTSGQLSRLVPNGRKLFTCCIDLGRQAEDTTGNALETSNWVELHEFTSIIVVTSSYHMPRTRIELELVLPDTVIFPHSVEPRNFRTLNWWTDADVLRRMTLEYVKLLRALGRLAVSYIGIDPAGAPTRSP